ncbi:hypothetical protein Acr_29g0002800 [Actinidia rufa]|uniref:Uncharacterized protein n=1 Tax=Actinidia rufa TaxID=165716 RepID=A0A7J0HDH9_9ERIC|nr:hypothetical protein Acr_29g0002800 [Actinidia rufa]
MILNILRSPPAPIDFSRSLSGDAASAGGVFFAAESGVDAADLAVGVRVVAAGDFAGFDALWIGDVLHWIHVDALGSRIGDVLLCGWDRFKFVDARTRDSLSHESCRVAGVAEKGGSRGRLATGFGGDLEGIIFLPITFFPGVPFKNCFVSEV